MRLAPVVDRHGKTKAIALKLRNRAVTRDSLRASGIQFEGSDPFYSLNAAAAAATAAEATAAKEVLK